MSAAGTTTKFLSEFRTVCGGEHILEDPAELQGYEILGLTPSVAVSPGSPEEVVGILRVANEHGLSVVPAGAETRPSRCAIPHNDAPWTPAA